MNETLVEYYKRQSLISFGIGIAVGGVIATWITLILTTIMLNQTPGCGPP